MGKVYLALDVRLGRKVALKFLQPELLTDEGKLRFLREARAAAALDHPNICTIFEIGEADGAPYLAMQYIEGETLSGMLAGGTLDMRGRIEIAIQIAAALEAAHANGIIHRDIKPSNILVTPSRQAKVLDFGLAKSIRAADSEETVIPMTEPGTISGTRPYMSPEQLRGEDVDARSDLFSFGVMLYEMFNGRRPFDRSSPESTIAAILFSEPPTLTEPLPLLKQIDKIVRRALRKERQSRYPSAAEMGRDLAACRENSDGATMRLKRSAPEAKTTTATAAAQPKRKTSARIKSIAMLRPHNVSDDPEMEYVVHGIGEEVIREISGIPQLRVIAAGSSLREIADDPIEVGRQLRVDVVIVSELRRVAGELVLRAALVRCNSGERIWADELRAAATSPHVIAHDVAEAVRAKMPVKRRAAPRSAVDPAAMQLYLKGRHQWSKRSAEGLREAMHLFRSAIECAPLEARGYAGLADGYNVFGFTEVLPPREAFPKARAAAARAIELDPAAADAHASLAYATSMFDWNFVEGERLFRRAIELDPNYAWAHHWLGLIILMSQHRFDEALASVRRAAELDPLTSMMNMAVGIVLHYSRRCEEALRVYRNILDAEPNHHVLHLYTALTYEQLGKFDESIAHFERGEALGGSKAAMFAASRSHVLALAGRHDEAAALGQQVEATGSERYVSGYTLAIIRLGLGDLDGALSMLDRAFEERSAWVTLLPVDPRFDPIRKHPRLAELAQKHGLPAGLL